MVKLRAYEKSKDVVQIEESIKISKYLDDVGCDAIEVSCGIIADGFWSSRGIFPFEIMKQDVRVKQLPKFILPVVKPILEKQMGSPKPYRLFNLDSAMKIKESVNIPVIVVGGIREIEDVEDIIQNEKCDYVSMAKPFIIEPNLVNKFKDKKQTKSRCIDWNYCLIGGEVRPLKCYYVKVSK